MSIKASIKNENLGEKAFISASGCVSQHVDTIVFFSQPSPLEKESDVMVLPLSLCFHWHLECHPLAFMPFEIGPVFRGSEKLSSLCSRGPFSSSEGCTCGFSKWLFLTCAFQVFLFFSFPCFKFNSLGQGLMSLSRLFCLGPWADSAHRRLLTTFAQSLVQFPTHKMFANSLWVCMTI